MFLRWFEMKRKRGTAASQAPVPESSTEDQLAGIISSNSIRSSSSRHITNNNERIAAPEHTQGASSINNITGANSNNDGNRSSTEENDKGCNRAAVEALSMVCRSGLTKIDELQLVSLLHCNVCRESNASWKLRINDDTPASLMRLIQTPRTEKSMGKNSSDRVNLPLSIRHLRYELKGPVEHVVWPQRLLRLSFGDKFNQSLEALRWAPRLQLLWLGQRFNQPVEVVDWPPSLRELRFGYSFNQPVERVRWPSGLEQLVFGYQFNRPISGMKEWPPSLRLLSFGHAFDQTLQGVALPRNLEFLEFGHEFNNPMEGVRLPETLMHLRFFHSFNQPLREVYWPLALRHVWLCGCFAQPVGEVDWPPGLKVLALPYRFKEESDQDLVQLPFGCRLQLVGCG